MIRHKIFLDSEFTGLQKDSSLISIALLADSGEDFYAEFTDYNQHQIDGWLKDHVTCNLSLNDSNQSPDNMTKLHVKGTKTDIKTAIVKWLMQFGEEKHSLQVWGDCPAWDWVLFCDLFGGAFGIPDSLHPLPMDLGTLFYLKTSDADMKRVDYAGSEVAYLELKQHNARYDVYLIKACYEKLMR